VDGVEPRQKVLTGRQQEILRLIGAGLSSKRIARQLGISHLTVLKHRANILAALDLHSSAALAAYAHVAGFAPHAGAADRLSLASVALTPREREIALQLLLGKTSKEIARALNTSHQTVRKHRENLHAKLGVNTAAELIAVLHPLLGAP
jgi:DNA-binding CsgD family transcriptional regulator